MFAVAEVGRAIMTYNTLTKAVQDGVRHAASNGLLGNSGSISIDAALEAEIKNLVVYGDIQGNGQPLLEGLNVSQVTVTSPGPFLIEVSAAYPYTPFMGSTLPTFGFGGPVSLAVDLRAAMTMRALS
jgi:Flp pilus assembly protein TadG